MKQIPLTKGKFAIVDDEDYEWLMQWKWHILSESTGYVARNSLPHETVGSRRHHILMHREVNKTPKGMETDHINGNRLDNRKENLRTVLISENRKNRKKNRNGTSQYKGVSWHKQHGKWYARVTADNKSYSLGLFTNEHDAHKAYEEAATRLFGQFKRGIEHG